MQGSGIRIAREIKTAMSKGIMGMGAETAHFAFACCSPEGSGVGGVSGAGGAGVVTFGGRGVASAGAWMPGFGPFSAAAMGIAGLAESGWLPLGGKGVVFHPTEVELSARTPGPAWRVACERVRGWEGIDVGDDHPTTEDVFVGTPDVAVGPLEGVRGSRLGLESNGLIFQHGAELRS